VLKGRIYTAAKRSKWLLQVFRTLHSLFSRWRR